MTATYKKYTLQLNAVTDADVIKYLEVQANKNDAIRRALRLLDEREAGVSERGPILVDPKPSECRGAKVTFIP